MRFLPLPHLVATMLVVGGVSALYVAGVIDEAAYHTCGRFSSLLLFSWVVAGVVEDRRKRPRR